MNDLAIVDLYWERSETAIKETEIKYNKYLLKIANNILANFEDSNESVNDTYLKTWNSIPMNRPTELSTYLGRITRQTAIDIFRKRNRKKRKGSEYNLSLTEIEEYVCNTDTPDDEIDYKLLTELINSYLHMVPENSAILFIRRYYFLDSINEISESMHLTKSNVKTKLHRTREGLKEYLERAGFSI